MKFFKKLSLKIKLILGGIATALSVILFFFVRGKMRAKDKMNYELSKLESELKIVELEEESEEKVKKIEELKEKEAVVREKIKILEEKEVEEGREISLEELDKFFDERGF